jgi:hypothetical protein
MDGEGADFNSDSPHSGQLSENAAVAAPKIEDDAGSIREVDE